MSILFVSENEPDSISKINYLQDLLRLPRQSDIVEINQDKNWKLFFKAWMNSMLKLVFNIDTSVLTNKITEVESILNFQQDLEILKVLKMKNSLDGEKYEEIIDKIDKNEGNIILHQILIDALLQNYKPDQVIQILNQRKNFYQNYDNLGIWYYYFGKALILKGEIENGVKKFQIALENLDSDLQKDIKKEIMEWIGNNG